MKINVILNDNEILSFDSVAMTAEPFGEALKQAAIQIYSRWIAESPPQDHKLFIKDK